MLNKLLVILALIIFGLAMFIVGATSPDSVKKEIDTWFALTSDESSSEKTEPQENSNQQSN